MLEFNPYFRPTAKECLQNRIFDEIRVPGLEAAAPFKINIECDRNEYQFDYENMKAK
jgi:N-dimethylarginine dimethylaminohydrolase